MFPVMVNGNRAKEATHLALRDKKRVLFLSFPRSSGLASGLFALLIHPMPYRISAFLMMAFFCFAPASFAGGKADPKVNLSFHLETAETDNPKMIFPYEVSGQRKFFRRVPDITSHDIAAFGPFPSDDGQSYGVAFRLRDTGKNRLAALTTDNQGKWLVAQVNGRLVDAVFIDKPVSDGFIIIWKGVTLDEIHQYDKVAPRIGAEKTKKK